MTCDMTRAAMQAGPDAAWPSPSSRIWPAARLRGDRRRVVAGTRARDAIPPTFAIDVARRARLDTPTEPRRVSGVVAGICAAAVLAAVAFASFGTVVGMGAVEPVAIAALLVACGEAIVLAAWTLDTDVTRARWRR